MELNDLAQTSSNTQAQQSSQSSTPPRLILDFGWRKFRTLISDETKPNADPLYIIDYKQIVRKRIRFRRYSTDEIFGIGDLNYFSIDANYEVHGRKDQIIAQKRLETSYAHRSTAISTKDKPAKLTWYSDSNFTEWDFVCCDEQQLPIAKLKMFVWGLKRIGQIEFMGEHAHNKELQEEIVVTSMTLAYEMALRVGNLVNLVGAAFARPGHEPKARGPGHRTVPFASPRASTSTETGQAEASFS